MTKQGELAPDQLEALERILNARKDDLASRGQFPEEGKDQLVSALTVKLDANGDGEFEETFVMTSLMSIERSEPYVNRAGRRQIDVNMTRWSAKGYSETLGKSVEYVLSAVEQPRSDIVAQQSSADFPAEVTFRAIFDVRLDGQTIISGLEGTAHGTGWMSVPPDGDDYLTVNKDIQFGPVLLAAAVCAASRPVN
jgi:hypothetical protein